MYLLGILLILLVIMSIYIIFILLFQVIFMVSYYKIFEKAGRKNVEGLIPVYNEICSYTLSDLPNWYFALVFIPIIGFFITLYKNVKLSSKFTDNIVIQYLVGLFPFFGLPYLAFSNLEYRK